jgi:hypothetical protein
MNMRKGKPTRFLLCVNNKGYLASLEVHKVYQAIGDTDAEQHGLVRVIDESGEDYLFPERYFVAVELPSDVKRNFRKRTARRVPA